MSANSVVIFSRGNKQAKGFLRQKEEDNPLTLSCDARHDFGFVASHVTSASSSMTTTSGPGDRRYLTPFGPEKSGSTLFARRRFPGRPSGLRLRL
ncbi:hypothetical protein HPB47_025840 [Ixodes persulcatus]|uniref:Uncharacterized protein n=1 Tax=Ixodes persulcatus TaxID=34615 RepID=A0AC60Q0S5_IXOPE|nr:hypothetical protein HPB47_025840 [Ixodes persulcatus]